MLDYIIVQAGGRGSRLGYLTDNKPKALLPVENLPMLFHLFRKFPSKRFVIIADYQAGVLKRYLNAFADVTYLVVEAPGSGTASGVRQALELVPEDAPLMLVWSDLILPESFQLPEDYRAGTPPTADYAGISTTFPCRWSYRDGAFREERSTEYGVAGLFLFRDKRVLDGVPESGELVRWMGEQALRPRTLSLAGTREFGLLEEYEALPRMRCRPFNRITVEDGRLVKEPVDEQGVRLARLERAWYEKAQALRLRGLPEIYRTDPLTMEWIPGEPIYQRTLSRGEQSAVLEKLVDALDRIHAADSAPADSFSLREAYFTKTMKRLAAVEHLVPYAREPYITVNGRRCRNVFYVEDELERRAAQLRCDRFRFIHGDCTFSNLLLREDGAPVLIDPRGYFGFTEMYGDVRYDWAKLYYSLAGNYDRFNLKQFRLSIAPDRPEVTLNIASNGWEDAAGDFFRLTGADPDEIRLLHALIWLSLTTYAWEDYDSICGAFYNGLYYLEEAL